MSGGSDDAVHRAGYGALPPVSDLRSGSRRPVITSPLVDIITSCRLKRANWVPFLQTSVDIEIAFTFQAVGNLPLMCESAWIDYRTQGQSGGNAPSRRVFSSMAHYSRSLYGCKSPTMKRGIGGCTTSRSRAPSCGNAKHPEISQAIAPLPIRFPCSASKPRRS